MLLFPSLAGDEMTDRGVRTLKGIPDSWQLYAAEV
jgi:hypothetical protein